MNSPSGFPSAVSVTKISPENTVLFKILCLVFAACYVVMRPEVYKLTHSLLHNTLKSDGTPSEGGKLIHAAVAGVAVAVTLHYAPGYFLVA